MRLSFTPGTQAGVYYEEHVHPTQWPPQGSCSMNADLADTSANLELSPAMMQALADALAAAVVANQARRRALTGSSSVGILMKGMLRLPHELAIRVIGLGVISLRAPHSTIAVSPPPARVSVALNWGALSVCWAPPVEQLSPRASWASWGRHAFLGSVGDHTGAWCMLWPFEGSAVLGDTRSVWLLGQKMALGQLLSLVQVLLSADMLRNCAAAGVALLAGSPTTSTVALLLAVIATPVLLHGVCGLQRHIWRLVAGWMMWLYTFLAWSPMSPCNSPDLCKPIFYDSNMRFSEGCESWTMWKYVMTAVSMGLLFIANVNSTIVMATCHL